MRTIEVIDFSLEDWYLENVHLRLLPESRSQLNFFHRWLYIGLTFVDWFDLVFTEGKLHHTKKERVACFWYFLNRKF